MIAPAELSQMNPSQLFDLQQALSAEAATRGLTLPIGEMAAAGAKVELAQSGFAEPYKSQDPKELLMVGLGRMGANLGRRAVRGGHQVIGYDVSPEVTEEFGAQGDGFRGTVSIEEAIHSMEHPVAWVMLPSGQITRDAIREVAGHMIETGRGGTIIDGGNTWYYDDMTRAKSLARRQRGIKPDERVKLVDCGTSGGVWGLDRGYSLMIGGPEERVNDLGELFKTLSPGVEAASRTPGRQGEPQPPEWGYLHAGNNGAGHLIKMVHNGIEYGMMSAVAEGLGLIDHIDRVDRDVEDASGNSARKQLTGGTSDLKYFKGLNLAEIADVAEVWRRGSVVGSWLVDLTAQMALENLDVPAWVPDSGEGRWTLAAANQTGYPLPTISASMNERFASRNGDLALMIQNWMRKAFGGHVTEVGKNP